MTDIAAIKADIHERLTFIKQQFIEQDLQTSPIFGSNLDAGFNLKDSTNPITVFLKNIYHGYDTFKIAYGSEITITGSTGSTIDEIKKKVLIRDVRNSTYTTPTAYTSWDGKQFPEESVEPNSRYYFTEVNLSQFLKPDGQLAKALNQMRKVYSTLDPSVLQLYKHYISLPSDSVFQKPFKVQQYMVTSTPPTTTNSASPNECTTTTTCPNSTGESVPPIATTEVKINSMDHFKSLKTDVESVLGMRITSSDILAIRRVLRAHELMANINIALFIYNATNDNAVYELCQKMLLYANLNMIRDLKTKRGESIPDLAVVLRNRSKAYERGLVKINQLDEKTAEQRMLMKTESERLASRRAREKKSLKILYVTLVVTVLVALVSIGAWFAPMDKKQKLSIIAIAFAVGIIVATVVNIVYTKTVENFVLGAATIVPQTVSDNLGAVGSLENMTAIHTARLADIVKYLSNTIQLSLMLTTYRTLGVMTNSLGRETSFYYNRAVQMDNTNSQLSNASEAVHLDQMKQRARIYYFISVMIVISLTIIVLVATDKFPQVKNIILGIAAVIVVIMTLAYILDTSGRVNTSAKKYYWRKPDTNALL